MSTDCMHNPSAPLDLDALDDVPRTAVFLLFARQVVARALHHGHAAGTGRLVLFGDDPDHEGDGDAEERGGEHA